MIRFTQKKEGDPTPLAKPEKKVAAPEAPAEDAEAPALQKKGASKGWGKRSGKAGK